MFVIFLCVSAAIFFAGVFLTVKMKSEDRIPWQSLLLIMLLVTAISMWFAVLPLVEEGSLLYKPLYAAFYVLESAIGNVDYSLFSDNLPPSSLWRIYTILIHLLMPITTYGVVLVYFMKAFSWFRYSLFRSNKKIIIFSELTDKSRSYANRIKAKDTLFIFCNTEDGEKEHFSGENAGNIIFTNQSEIQLMKQLKKKNLTIMEMSNDEERNLQKSIEIIHYLDKETDISDEDKKTINLYTVNSQFEAATLLDNAMGRGSEKTLLGFRQAVINEYKYIALKLLFDRPLYKYIDNKTNSLDVMLVGFGQMGQEILKGVSWAGTFLDSNTNIHVISSEAVENGRRLLSECPEMGQDLRHKEGFLSPDHGIQLNKKAPIYYYNTGTEDPEFDEIIRSLTQCSYIVVDTGDDMNTVAAALKIYRLFMQEGYLRDLPIDPPELHIRIQNDENLQLFSTKEDLSVFSHFTQFGSDSDIYTEKQFGRSDFDHLAKRTRNVYRDLHDLDDEKSKYAYLPEAEKNANQAIALHVLYKLNFFTKISVRIIEGNHSKEELEKINALSQTVFDSLVSDEERESAANWEHIRWQAYSRAEGYVQCPYEKIKKLFDKLYEDDWSDAVRKTQAALQEARIHPCIGDDDGHLKQISTLLGDPNDSNYYHNYDRRFIDSIPDIIRDIYEIVPKK